ncbi:type II toxin-antitoxin system VapB family antitoxin [Akkermansiaceae bacterium]|nr:type II toxin-antitoxin system VapB family antitoxin [Akkermansiaceae bacterium]
MRTTVTIDDSLIESASMAASETNISSLITKALEAFVSAESKKRLLMLSGGSPEFTIPGRDSRASDHSMLAEDSTEYTS